MGEPIIESAFHYKDYQCCIIFHPMGHRCGYVLVPHYHDYFEKDFKDIPIYCHGGLSYSSHKLLGEEYPGWWIGFDCAHWDDLEDVEYLEKYYGFSKKVQNLKIMNERLKGFATVKSLDFCRIECKNIVDQLIEKG